MKGSDLADFLDNAPVPIHSVDANARIVWANRAELELLGYSADEYIGHPIAEFHADPVVLVDMLERLDRGETLHDYEARLRAKVLARHRPEERAAPDRALRIGEAAAMLAMSKDYIYRNSRKLGAYRDTDGHIKFTMSAVQQHLRRVRR